MAHAIHEMHDSSRAKLAANGQIDLSSQMAQLSSLATCAVAFTPLNCYRYRGFLSIPMAVLAITTFSASHAMAASMSHLSLC